MIFGSGLCFISLNGNLDLCIFIFFLFLFLFLFLFFSFMIVLDQQHQPTQLNSGELAKQDVMRVVTPYRGFFLPFLFLFIFIFPFPQPLTSPL